jgi:hypothetical protein
VWVTWLLLVLGVVLVVVSIVYFTRAESQLPTWLPGHDAAVTHHKHIKHGAATLLLAAACFVGAWFTTGHRHAEA